MYAQNEKFDQLEKKLRENAGAQQQELITVMDQLQTRPLAQWFDLLSGAFIVAGSQGIQQATQDQATRAKRKVTDDELGQLTNRLFKQFCDAAANPHQVIAQYLNDDISMILERSADVSSWAAFEALTDKPLLLAQLLYIWYLGWQRGYAFTAEIDMKIAKKQGLDARLAKTTDEQLHAACAKIAVTESAHVLAEIFHDADAQEQIYLMLLAYLKTAK